MRINIKFLNNKKNYFIGLTRGTFSVFFGIQIALNSSFSCKNAHLNEYVDPIGNKAAE